MTTSFNKCLIIFLQMILRDNFWLEPTDVLLDSLKLSALQHETMGTWEHGKFCLNECLDIKICLNECLVK